MPSLGLLVFVLLLVYPLCLLIKDGIFFFLKKARIQASTVYINTGRAAYMEEGKQRQ